MLGETAFTVAWTAGQDLSFDKALDEAHQVLRAVIATDEPAGLPGIRFTPRERDVLRLLADGCSDRQIATALSISPKTAGNHVSHILAKLSVDTRAAAASAAIRQGLA
jgi:DNA-binding NarL/FixJ family response regulator